MRVVLYLVQLPPHFDRVSEKTMDGSNVIRHKVSFLATLGHFGAFLAIKEPLDRNAGYFQKSENVTFPPYKVVTPGKISEKYNG